MPIRKLRAFNANELVRDTDSAALVTNLMSKVTKSLVSGKSKLIGKFKTFSLYVDARNKEDVLYFAAIGSDPAGVIEMDLTKRNKVEFSFVYSKFSGQGLGTQLYETALSALGYLHSSTSLSVGSSKVWRGLCEKHNGVVVLDDQHVAIEGYEEREGFHFPRVKNISNHIVTLDPRSGGISRDEQWAREGFYYEIRK